jgi:hypothetical protein
MRAVGGELVASGYAPLLIGDADVATERAAAI